MASRRGSRALLLLAALVLAAVVAILLVTGPLNPFGTDTKDRSQPVLLKSLENLSDYHAATNSVRSPLMNDGSSRASCSTSTTTCMFAVAAW